MIAIAEEAYKIESDEWAHSYSREVAAYPTQTQKLNKYWPTVGRIDNAQGDRVLVCTCPAPEEYMEAAE